MASGPAGSRRTRSSPLSGPASTTVSWVAYDSRLTLTRCDVAGSRVRSRGVVPATFCPSSATDGSRVGP